MDDYHGKERQEYAKPYCSEARVPDKWNQLTAMRDIEIEK
jgi:hypothetical protein